jgi:hypothetical protein
MRWRPARKSGTTGGSTSGWMTFGTNTSTSDLAPAVSRSSTMACVFGRDDLVTFSRRTPTASIRYSASAPIASSSMPSRPAHSRNASRLPNAPSMQPSIADFDGNTTRGGTAPRTHASSTATSCASVSGRITRLLRWMGSRRRRISACAARSQYCLGVETKTRPSRRTSSDCIRLFLSK